MKTKRPLRTSIPNGAVYKQVECPAINDVNGNGKRMQVICIGMGE